MRVSTVTVGFSRSRQPAQYESAKAEVSYTAVIDENDAAGAVEGSNHVRSAALLLASAAAVVYNQLGLKVPLPDGTTLAQPVETPTPEGTAAPVVPLQRRTRRTKEQIAADEAAANSGASASAATSAPSAPTTPAASSATTQANASPALEPWEVDAAPVPPAADKVITDNDLQAAASKAAAPTSIGGAAVKALMGEFKVGRLGELDQPRRREFIAKLDALVAAKGK